MKRSELKQILKEIIIDEITQKNINSVHPTRIDAFNKNDDRSWTPNLKKMTLSNLKALREKCLRFINAIKNNKEVDKILLKLEYDRFYLYDTEIKKRLKYINKSISVKEDHGLGYSHNSSFDDIKGKRIPLTDPLLTGKYDEINENDDTIYYRFDDYNWLGNMAGFNKPSDVYYGTILLGVIESKPDRFIIVSVMNDKKGGSEKVKLCSKNNFKTRIEAAKVLHQLWRNVRNKK